MRAINLALEALRSTWRSPAPAMLIGIVASAMCVTSLLTVGRTAVAVADVAAALERAGSREITVTTRRADTQLIDANTVAVAASVASVERVVAIGAAVDSSPPATLSGEPLIPTWPIVGDPTAAVSLTSGRLPVEGEAVVSEAVAQKLGLDGSVGELILPGGLPTPIVGWFRARDPFDELDDGALIAGGRDTDVRTMSIVVDDAAEVPATARVIAAVIASPDPALVQIESPRTLALLEAEVGNRVATYGAGMLTLLLCAGGLLIACVVLADVLIRRRDLGRRRALGASRPALMVIVVLRAALPAAVGAVVASACTTALLTARGEDVSISFVIGVSALASFAAVAAAVPPAVAAAYRDPVLVLRTP